MKARKLILTIVALFAAAVSMNAFAQNPSTPKKVEQTIEGKWNAKTVGSPIGEIEFNIIITKTDEGYKASVPGYEISNAVVTEKSFTCTTSTMGMTVGIDMFMTDKGTLEGDAMGIGIIAEKEVAKKAEEKK